MSPLCQLLSSVLPWTIVGTLGTIKVLLPSYMYPVNKCIGYVPIIGLRYKTSLVIGCRALDRRKSSMFNTPFHYSNYCIPLYGYNEYVVLIGYFHIPQCRVRFVFRSTESLTEILWSMFDAVCDNKALTIVLHQLWKCRYIYIVINFLTII